MTDRIDKINELIKQEVGKIILKEVDMSKDILVTVTKTKTSPDLQQSTVYITTLPKQKSKDTLRELLVSTFNIQKILNKKLHLKQVPKIEFKQDKQAAAEQKVFELLSKSSNERKI